MNPTVDRLRDAAPDLMPSFAVDIEATPRARRPERKRDTAERARDTDFTLDVRFTTTARRVVVRGPSGAGKSLMLQAIAGLLRPRRGRIVVLGRCVFDSASGIDVPARQRDVGFLFQDYALFPHLTVRQNVNFGLARSLCNPTAAMRDPRAERWLEALGIAAFAERYPDQLSGGQRQRTALARALARTPRALLLDEPFAALDPALRERLRDELDALQRSLALPMMLVTHDDADVERFGDELIEIEAGRVCRHELRTQSTGRPLTEAA